MGVMATLTAAAKAASAWALKHKIAVDAAVAMGEKVIKGKLDGKNRDLETALHCLENEIRDLKSELENIKKTQKKMLIIISVIGIILVVLAFFAGMLVK